VSLHVQGGMLLQILEPQKLLIIDVPCDIVSPINLVPTNEMHIWFCISDALQEGTQKYHPRQPCVKSTITSRHHLPLAPSCRVEILLQEMLFVDPIGLDKTTLRGALLSRISRFPKQGLVE